MTLFDGGSISTALLCVAMLAVGVFLLRRSYRYFGRRRSNGSAIVQVPRPGRSLRGLPVDASAELTRQEVQLHERERDASARLDSKMGVLQHLIHQAQDTITRLEALVAEAKQVAGAEAPVATIAADPGTMRASVGVTADVSASGTDAGGDNATIYSMADQGLSAVTIAHHVGEPLDKIETILSQRRQP